MQVSDASFGPSPPQAVTVGSLGALRWAELAVFGLAGGWVLSTPEPTARVLLAGVSRHAARRAGVLGDRLPPEGALKASVVTVPASAELAELLAEVERLDRTAVRLGVLGGVVLDGMADALDALVGTMAPVADATNLRLLPSLVADLRTDARQLTDAAAGLAGGAAPADAASFASRVSTAGGWTPRPPGA